MKSAKRWTREAILHAGNVYAFDGEDGGEQEQKPDGGSGQDDSESGKGQEPEKDEDDVDPAILKQRLKNKREEQERDFQKRKEAEKRADELQKIVDEAARKGKSELENAKADLEARDKVIAIKDDQIRRLAIENAFMTLKEIEWKNPATALRLVDLSEVEFDPESGKPKNPKQLLEAAKTLAKSDPYLVKSKTDVDEETPNGKGSGKPPGKLTPKGMTEEQLRVKYNIHS